MPPHTLQPSASNVSEVSFGEITTIQTNMKQLTSMTRTNSLQFRSEKERQIFMEVLRVALVSNVSNHILTLVDFVLLLHGIQAKSNKEDHSDHITTAQVCFLVLFILQAIYRLLLSMKLKLSSAATEDGTQQRKQYDSLELWEVFDMLLLFFSLVGACVEGLWSSVAILPRILRAIRLVCVEKLGFRCLYSLRQLVQTMTKATGTFFFSVVLLVLQILVFAAFAMELVQVKLDEAISDHISEKFGKDIAKQCCDAFSTLVLSTSTLFSLAMGNQWDSVALPIISVKPWTLAFFMLHVLVASGLLIGTLYAVLSLTLVDWKSQQVTLQDERLMQEKQMAIIRLRELFTSMDTNRDGFLTWDEFYYNRQNNPECQRIFNKLDIGDDNLNWLWSCLDSNQDGHVSPEEFVNLMWRLQSQETKWTLIQNSHIVKQIHARVEGQNKATEQGFSLLHAELQKQHRNIQALLDRSSKGTVADANVPEERTSSDEKVTELSIDKDVQSSASAAKNDTESHVESLTLEVATKHLRGVMADKVAYYNRTEVIDFWGSGAFLNAKMISKEFQMSQACKKCDFFVSHCWNGPEDWYKYFKRNDPFETYAYKKAMVVHHILTERAPVDAKSQTLQDMVSQQSFSALTSERSELDSFSRSLSRKMSASASVSKSLSMMSTSERSNTYSTASTSPDSKSGRMTTRKASVKDKALLNESMSNVMLWIDKCCIPQNDEQERAECVKLIEEFMQLSGGFIVILSWNYFTRLWCVYEWACYFRSHSLSDQRIFIGCDAFLRSNPEETLPLYLASIEKLSVAECECQDRKDHKILEDKVFHYYQGENHEESFASFERFSKCTAIGFLGKQIVRFRARGSPEDQNAWLGPILALSKRLKYWDLYDAMSTAEPARWFELCDKDLEQFELIVEFWFQRIVVKYLGVERNLAARPRFMNQDHSGDLFVRHKDPKLTLKVQGLFRNKGFGKLADLFAVVEQEAQGEGDTHSGLPTNALEDTCHAKKANTTLLGL